MKYQISTLWKPPKVTWSEKFHHGWFFVWERILLVGRSTWYYPLEWHIVSLEFLISSWMVRWYSHTRDFCLRFDTCPYFMKFHDFEWVSLTRQGSVFWVEVTSPQIFSQISNWSYMFLMKKVPKYQFGSDKDLLWIYIRSKSWINVIE